MKRGGHSLQDAQTLDEALAACCREMPARYFGPDLLGGPYGKQFKTENSG